MKRDLIASVDDSLPSNQIRGSEKKTLIGAWLGAILLTAIPLIFLWHVHALWLKAGFPSPMVGFVLLIGTLLFGRAIWETIRLKRFGDPRLDLARVPVPLGGKVEGRIVLGPRYTTAPEFALKLQCIRSVTRNTGKNSHTVENILWSGKGRASLLPGGLVPVSLSIPGDQVETSNENPWNRILWRLTVTAPFRGIKFLEKYEIPVQGRSSLSEAGLEASRNVNATASTPKSLFLATLPFLIAGIGILIGGFYLLTFGVADVIKANASVGWPTAAGHIVNSTPPYGTAIFANPQVVYSYEVKGVPYSTTVIYPHLFWKRTVALEMARDFSGGAPVTVHYSPADPGNASLLPGLRAGAFQRLVLSLLTLVTGLLFASSAVLAPKDAVMKGSSITYRQGTLGSSIFGYAFLAIFALGIVLWIVS